MMPRNVSGYTGPAAPGSLWATVGSFAIGVVAIAAATVAVSLGKIDGSTFTAIVSVFGGIGAGAGAHAAGVKSGSG